ncbi:MAG: leucine-rich repeat domain-containing protein, partial [Clostridia bacterium]|nr:leucine-rich repeat domain-containing protein [Clostridia bacterium]
GEIAIGDNAFAGCNAITALTIPVTDLTGYFSDAFSSVQTVTVLSGANEISASAFAGFTALTTVNMPDSVMLIGNNAFDGCALLTGVTIPANVTAIGDSAFAGCASLTEMTIPNKVTSIGNSAFSGCASLTGMTYGSGLTSIGESAFADCVELTAITLPDSVNTLGTYAFGGCTGLTGITIPESVTVIADSAFSGCSQLSGITIPVCHSYAHQWAKSHSFNTFVITHQQLVTDPAVPPTCEETGLTEGQHCDECEEILLAQEVVAALGHDWQSPVYTWSENHQNLTALRVCGRDTDHTESETVTASAEITLQPTCEEMGRTTYTSNRFTNAAFAAQTLTLTDVPALGHSWGAPVYEWAADHSGVTATRICTRDTAHVETETANATSTIAQAPTCEGMGQTTYTGKAFINEAFTAQAVTLTDIPALGHIWGDAVYTWADDMSTVTARHTCTRDTGHTESETVQVNTSVALQPTCEEMGNTTYTSQAFTHAEFAVQTKTKTDIPALGHDWNEPVYTWAEDLKTVTARRVCSRNANHAEKETVSVTRTISLEPTENTTGTFTLTGAVFSNTAFVQQVKTEIIPALKDLHILSLPAALTAIESEAFADLDNIDAVRIPAGVTFIAEDAFDRGIILIAPARSYAETWANGQEEIYFVHQ